MLNGEQFIPASAKVESSQQRPYIILCLIAAFVGACLIYLILVGNSMAAVHAPLTKTAIKIQAEASLAHLWYMEVSAQNPDTSFGEVWKHLDTAEKFARAMLDGGETPDRTLIALHGCHLDTEIENILQSLGIMRKISLEHFSSLAITVDNPEPDMQMDAVFKLLVAQTEELESHLQQDLNSELIQFRTTGAVILIIGLFLALATLLLFRNYERLRHKRLAEMQNTNLELTAVHQQATAMNEELLHEIDERRKVEGALKESEEHFRFLYDNAPLAYQSLDESGSLIEVNQEWLDLLGQTRSEVIGHSLTEYLAPEFGEAIKEKFPKFKVQGQIKNLEFDFLHANGSIVVVSVDGRVSHNHDGSFRQTHCMLTDVTERRAAAVEKAKLEDQLRQTQKLEAIGVLAGGIAHDFNNVLFGILGYCDLARETIAKDHPAQDYLAELTKAGNRAADLVKQILTFARHGERRVGPVDLLPLVKEVSKLMRATLPASIEIKQQICIKQATVIADPTEIHQVLLNLCTNAAHAMTGSAGTLEIAVRAINLDPDAATTYQTLEPGDYVLLTVSDSGHGIPKELLERIFEPFFTTKQRGEGTGMGLAVIHSIVAELGGCIQVYSEPGTGSTFNVFLPQVLVKETSFTSGTEALPRGTERVMVVDDEIALVQMLEKMLTGLGYKVMAFTKSEDALARFSQEPQSFDLVITDHEMPHLTGSELASAMLALSPQTPIILCSGYSRSIKEVMVRGLGIREFANKPLSRGHLAKIVRNTLDGTGTQQNKGTEITTPTVGA